MAIKDWKLEANRQGVWAWLNNKSNKLIIVDKNSFNNKWYVYYDKKSTNPNGLTKSQALKLAKSYMRKH